MTSEWVEIRYLLAQYSLRWWLVQDCLLTEILDSKCELSGKKRLLVRICNGMSNIESSYHFEN